MAAPGVPPERWAGGCSAVAHHSSTMPSPHSSGRIVRRCVQHPQVAQVAQRWLPPFCPQQHVSHGRCAGPLLGCTRAWLCHGRFICCFCLRRLLDGKVGVAKAVVPWATSGGDRQSPRGSAVGLCHGLCAAAHTMRRPVASSNGGGPQQAGITISAHQRTILGPVEDEGPKFQNGQI